jgi:hypothetical protein
MPGTRTGVLAELMAWATDPQSPPIYLLTGMAGTGKSAIARSFARLLDQKMLLGASFFCSRTSEARSNVGGIIPSLAFYLAWHSDTYARTLIGAIKTNPGVTFNLRPVDFQFTTLILQPSQALSNQVRLPIVMIDALDECSNTHLVEALLKNLIKSNGVRNFLLQAVLSLPLARHSNPRSLLVASASMISSTTLLQQIYADISPSTCMLLHQG